MKKRQRKKKHCGEHAEWGRQVVIARARKDGFDGFLDAFILEAIEANGCLCGGGGREDKLDVIVELGRETDDREGRIRGICAWLDGRGDVADYRIGALFDLWHDDCPEDSALPSAIPELALSKP
jgi:uncharacterized protein